MLARLRNLSPDARLAVFLWLMSLLGAAAILIISTAAHAASGAGTVREQACVPTVAAFLFALGAVCAVLGVVVARASARPRGGI